MDIFSSTNFEKTLLFIDFDGVLCDSVDECYVTSYIAYEEYYKLEPGSSVSVADKTRFNQYRPYIRRGEDYMILQDCVRKDVNLTCQADFDAVYDTLDTQLLSDYEQTFYGVRRRILKEQRDWWMRLNPLFNKLKNSIIKSASRDNIHILSNKFPAFIKEILTFHGIKWDESRIHHPGEGSKYNYMIGLLGQNNGGSKGIFIDDQFDHLIFPDHNKVIPVLASWGYTTREALNSPGNVTVYTMSQFIDLVEAF